MLKKISAQSGAKELGFTLIETIIYIGLFSLIFTGIFVSIYPLFTSAEKLSRNVAAEGETAFILSKIDYALSKSMTDSDGEIVSPTEGGPSTDELIINYSGAKRFHFKENTSDCTVPQACTLTLYDSEIHSTENAREALNATRVIIRDFQVTQNADYDAGGNLLSRYIEVTFKTSDDPEDTVGPVRYYVHF